MKLTARFQSNVYIYVQFYSLFQARQYDLTLTQATGIRNEGAGWAYDQTIIMI